MPVPTDILRLGEKERLLALFERRGKQGVFVYELTNSRPDGLGISQYGRAIKQLRDGDLNNTKYNIVNVYQGFFVLENGEAKKVITVAPEVPTESVEQRLENLKIRFAEETDEDKKRIMEMQERALKRSLGQYQFENTVTSALL